MKIILSLDETTWKLTYRRERETPKQLTELTSDEVLWAVAKLILEVSDRPLYTDDASLAIRNAEFDESRAEHVSSIDAPATPEGESSPQGNSAPQIAELDPFAEEW